MNAAPLDAEWLEADGMGGFASGTVAGYRTRRYHALLLTATTPPTGRVVLVNGLEAWVRAAGGHAAAVDAALRPGRAFIRAASTISSAFAHEPWPRWTFRLPGRHDDRARDASSIA